jgi:hypothetical protein
MSTIRSAIWPSSCSEASGRPLEPVVEAAFRDAQHPAHASHFPLPLVMFDKAKTVDLRMREDGQRFFLICREPSAEHHFPCANSASPPLLVEGFRSPQRPCLHSRLLLHDPRESVLNPPPRSSAICLCDFPLVCTRRAASCLNALSCVCLVPIGSSLLRPLTSSFTQASKPGLLHILFVTSRPFQA